MNTICSWCGADYGTAGEAGHKCAHRVADEIERLRAALRALRAQLAEAQAERDQARAALDAEKRELAAAIDLAQHQAEKLHSALGDFVEVSGGFVETVCHHIRAMRRGVARLVVGRVITMSRGAEIMGLSIYQMRQWANSGIMQRDADAARPPAPATHTTTNKDKK